MDGCMRKKLLPVPRYFQGQTNGFDPSSSLSLLENPQHLKYVEMMIIRHHGFPPHRCSHSRAEVVYCEFNSVQFKNIFSVFSYSIIHSLRHFLSPLSTALKSQEQLSVSGEAGLHLGQVTASSQGQSERQTTICTHRHTHNNNFELSVPLPCGRSCSTRENPQGEPPGPGSNPQPPCCEAPVVTTARPCCPFFFLFKLKVSDIFSVAFQHLFYNNYVFDVSGAFQSIFH